MGHAQLSPRFIKDQVEAYGESWKREHETVKEVSALEGVITIGRMLFSLLEKLFELWSNAVYRGTVETTVEASELFQGAYRVWLNVVREIVEVAEIFAKKGYLVEGAKE